MKKIIGGNWKINCNTETFDCLQKYSAKSFENIDAFIAVPAVYISRSARLFPPFIKVAAQDVSIYSNGPYTGEIAAHMLAEYGVKYVIVGHSERRWTFGETAKDISKKIKAAVQSGIRPVLCIGEPKKQRESNEYLKFLYEQLADSLGDIRDVEMDVAYEPVYAIGSGETACMKDISEVVHHLNGWITEFKIRRRIMYGGSVSEASISEVSKIRHLDGVLVGNASLEESFSLIAGVLSETY